MPSDMNHADADLTAGTWDRTGRPVAFTSRGTSAVISEDRRFIRRLLIFMVVAVFVGFSIEVAIDFFLAVRNAEAQGLTLSLADVQFTPTMIRSVTSPIARAYNNTLALILTFIGLAIPITANMYTPKLVEIFLRDRINVAVLCTYALLTAHSILAATLSFDKYAGVIPFWITFAGAILGWTLILPYYYYVLTFLNPVTIIDRVQSALVEEIQQAVKGRNIPLTQRHVNQKINNLGNVLLRAVDRADRDVAIDAINAHMVVMKRFHEWKGRLASGFFDVDDTIMVGMSSAAIRIVNRSKIWVEQRILTQLLLAYNAALGKMPDGVSTLADALKDAAHYEATHGEPAVFDLLVRGLNTFVREAIKKKDVFSIYNCFYNYKSLVRKLIVAGRTEKIPELCRYLKYYADFSKAQGMPFIYELASYELGELCEHASQQGIAEAKLLLDTLLSFEGAAQSVRLVKSRMILAGYLQDRAKAEELGRVLASLAGVPAATLDQARAEFAAPQEQVFWEITDRGVNFDYVDEARKARIREVFDRLAEERKRGESR